MVINAEERFMHKAISVVAQHYTDKKSFNTKERFPLLSATQTLRLNGEAIKLVNTGHRQ